jgi:hypothetical protein
MIKKLFQFVIVAIIISGLYGIIHNQITFTISNEYFTHFKFIQQQLPEYYTRHARLGASIVGWSSTWWMGIIIGLILGILWLWGDKLTIKDRFRALRTVLLTTIIFGIIGGIIAFTIYEQEKYYEVFSFPSYGEVIDTSLQTMTNPYAFLRAGMVHNCSYLGGAVGLLIGIYQLWKIRKTR